MTSKIIYTVICWAGDSAGKYHTNTTVFLHDDIRERQHYYINAESSLLGLEKDGKSVPKGDTLHANKVFHAIHNVMAIARVSGLKLLFI